MRFSPAMASPVVASPRAEASFMGSEEDMSFRSRFRLAISARMADACAALLVGDAGFHTEGAGSATAGGACTTSTPLILDVFEELAFPARASASGLQAPNATARCTRIGAYAASPVVVRAILWGGDW